MGAVEKKGGTSQNSDVRPPLHSSRDRCRSSTSNSKFRTPISYPLSEQYFHQKRVGGPPPTGVIRRRRKNTTAVSAGKIRRRASRNRRRKA